MTLQSLHIKRFQAHEDFQLDFDPHLTVITGKTDSGKSAILRALQWACLNQPSGEAFIRNFTGTAEVSLQVDDRIITRTRGKSINSYSIDGKELEAFGLGNVPDEIAQFLNLSEVSFQNQLDPHFWLSQTPGQVSKELNKIINLGMIDKTMAYLASEARKAKSVVNVSETRLAASRERRDSLSWIQDADNALTALEGLQADIESKRNKCTQLQQLIEQIEEQEKIQRESAAVYAAGMEVVESGQKAIDLAKRLESLQKLVTAIESAEKLSKSKILQKEIDVIDAQIVTIEEKRKQRDRLMALIHDIEEAAASVDRWNKEKLRVEAELKKLTKGRCPVCNGEMK